MRDEELRERIHCTMNTRLPGVGEDPYLAQRVLVKAKGGQNVKKKVSVGVVLCFVLLVVSVAALAVTLLREYQVEMFENVDISDLLPEQWQQYDICHRVSSGYIVGGFELGDDYIAPMRDEDKILYLNESFTPVWKLDGAELDGCLFDRVEEAGDYFYFGMERQREEWIAALMKVSREGKILWMWEGKKDFRMKDFLATEEEAVYCAGRINASNEDAAVLLKVAQNGNLEWERSLEEYGATVLNAISKWENGLLCVGKCKEGIILFQIDEYGDVKSHVVYDVNEPIDVVRLQELADGRIALILTVNSGVLRENVTQEMKYMIVSNEVFE